MPRAKKIIEEPIVDVSEENLDAALSTLPPVTQAFPTPAKMKPVLPKQVVILKNVAGEDMDIDDYFYKGVVPPQFNATCGKPVDREDLITIFNGIFNPKHDILFYKTIDKEVYIIIIPLKLSSSVGASNESLDGDFQKHAISFISEGSVNGDTLKMKLRRILPFVKFGDN